MLTFTLLLISAAPGQPGPPARREAPRREAPRREAPRREAPRGGGAEARKKARDVALETAGQEALPFCKAYGELAVAAILECGARDGAVGLVGLFDSGDLDRVADPKAALQACAKHGRPVVLWLIANHEHLRDPDAMACFAEAPLDYAFDLRDVVQQARERKRAAPRVDVMKIIDRDHWEKYAIGLGCGGLLVAVCNWWKRRREGTA